MTLAAGTIGSFAASIPAVLLAGAGVLGVSGWVWLRRLTWLRQSSPGAPIQAARMALSLLRLALAFAALWLLMAALGRVLLLRTNWMLWPLALLGALAIEGVVWLYGIERRIVSRRTGLTLVALRVLLIVLVVLMLLQPVLQASWTETHRRMLPILVDTSASMYIGDKQLPPYARLRLAAALSVPAAQPATPVRSIIQSLWSLREALEPEPAWVERLTQGRKEAAQVQLMQRRTALLEKFKSADKAAEEQAAAVEKTLNEPQLPQTVRTAMMDVKAALNQQVRPRLQDSAGWMEEKNKNALAENVQKLSQALTRAGAELARMDEALERCSLDLDTQQYERLPAADKAVVDAVAGMSRLDIAKAALLHRPVPPGKGEKDAGQCLLERLSKDYDVQVYTFDSDLAPADVRDWRDPAPAVAQAARAAKPSSAAATATAPTQPGRSPNREPARLGASDPAAGNEKAKRTDLAGALRKVVARAGDSLAGVLVLSDGQDNSRTNLEPLARQMGGAGAAFCAVLTGDEKPPTDAAIVSVEAPETVVLNDKVFADVELKLDGLAGKSVRVSLLDGEAPVDSRTISVPAQVFRTQAQLADEPKKPGGHAYRLEIEPLEGEVFRGNNAYDLKVSVTEEKTKVLLADRRPRWEYRYLKNLFNGRDKTVRLQQLVLEPDRVAGQVDLKPVPASVMRKEGEEEAGAFPANEQEWMKFDVVILGDVPPEALGPEGMKWLRKFVADRGGTVVLIAGPDHLPGGYIGSAMAELIPLRLTGPSGTSLPAADADARLQREGFRLALTAAGKDHVICRQDVQPERSLQTWDSFPPAYWRSRFVEAALAGTVLVYAIDPNAPAYLTAETDPTTGPESHLRQREQYQREHALVVAAPYGLGKVLMLSFDQTWRLRYHAGDTHHHKFWGQVLRWATAGKLPAGTTLVKMGADRVRYAAHERPVVRAKIVREDFSPLVSEKVAVKVFDARNKLIASAPMRYLKDSQGMYSATLEELPAGAYRLELDAPEAEELLAREGVKSVSTGISVDPAAPTEQIELAGNRHLLTRLAGLSYKGVVLSPHELGRLERSLPEATWKQERSFQFELWDSWPLLLLFCAAATSEWVLRKRVGLS